MNTMIVRKTLSILLLLAFTWDMKILACSDCGAPNDSSTHETYVISLRKKYEAKQASAPASSYSTTIMDTSKKSNGDQPSQTKPSATSASGSFSKDFWK